MKTLLFNLTILAFLLASVSCGSVGVKEEKSAIADITKEKIEVYYFHNSHRCATCVAVEDVTLASLEELYSNQMQNDSLTFKSIDLEDVDSEDVIQKLEVSGQSLLIVAGSKIENLTTDAFMNARTNPDKLKELIKLTIDPLLAE